MKNFAVLIDTHRDLHEIREEFNHIAAGRMYSDFVNVEQAVFEVSARDDAKASEVHALMLAVTGVEGACVAEDNGGSEGRKICAPDAARQVLRHKVIGSVFPG